MPRIIDAPDASADWDAIEAERDTPRELSEQDWELLEALAAAGGPDGGGDLRRWGMPSTQRLLELLEVPGPRLMHCINLLLLARRDDVIEAIAEADYSGDLLPAIKARCSELHTERNRRAPRGPRATEPAPAAPPRPKGRQAGQADAERWQRAQAAPQEALAAVAEILAGGGTAQSKLRRSASLLGIRHQVDSKRVMTDAEVRAELNARLQALGGEPLEGMEAAAGDPHAEQWRQAQANPAAAIEKAVAIRTSGGTAKERTLAVAALLGIPLRVDWQRVPVNRLRQAIAERLAALEDLASSISTGPMAEVEPAAVVITPLPEPAPAAEPQTWVVELGPPPLLTAEMLLAEALDPAHREPTTQAAISGWQARPGTPWQEWFRHVRDHLGPSAAATISTATGASLDQVIEHGRQVMERHQAERAELRAAYPDLQGLLQDAVSGCGWEWFAEALGVGIEALWGHAAELHRQASDNPQQAA